ncbi:cupin domain-containing protein [Aquirufa ecclesiirivi]|uniref:Cupin domain-containing protein n=1 Tax=Aquirufa ecclesiirivi TaxID=2715124 RepID=A0ABT4JGE3_9BACT|nr:cupin domain-containing protein [Aquirufa ecclesiirivi]MCZ2475344.1 cupin domain-containing protein [Aquirufa ecclesiirivi]
MNRHDFLLQSGMLTALTGIPNSYLQSNSIDQTKPFLLPPLPPLDHKGSMDIRVRVKSSMTNGIYSNVECAVAPKTMGPAPHIHKELDELMFVLEGTASVIVGEEIVQVQAGGWHFRPRMIEHTFWNASEKPLLFIDMYFNQPFEEYLERVFHQLTAENGYPNGSEAKGKEIRALQEKFGLMAAPNAAAKRLEIIKKYDLT